MTSESVTSIVQVQRISYLSADGSAIFVGKSDEGLPVKVVARRGVLPYPPTVGECWSISGEPRVHSRYGPQLHATECRFLPPTGRLVVRYLADSPDFEGLGRTKAEALYAAFGSELAALLDQGDPKPLEAVLSGHMAVRLVETWAAKRAEAAVVSFLDRHGFDVRLANKLRAVWGGRVIEMLERNPYYILAFSSFAIAERAARKLGVNPDDARRLVGAVEASSYERLDEGHTLTPHDEMVALARKKLKADKRQADYAISEALAEGAIVGTREAGYQPIGAAALESGIAVRLLQMLSGVTPLQKELLDGCVDRCATVNQSIADAEKAQSFPFNDEQKRAIELPFLNQFSLITGGAGVGKTTVIRAIIDTATRLHMPVHCVALAGRAAMRISEATGYRATTIAKFLLDAKNRRLEVTPQSIVLVDESSMLDLPTLYRILHFMPIGARLVLVGDEAQLPPIGFGLVLHKLVQMHNVPRVALTRVHRQAEVTGIPMAAFNVRNHMVPELIPYSGKEDGVFFLASHSAELNALLHILTDDWKGEDFRILSAVKAGQFGVDAVNMYFHVRAAPDDAYAVGEPVMHTYNDYDLGVMNGSLGVVVSVGDSGYAIDFDGELKSISFEEASERLVLAYAITVHKAQGSQFDRVAVVVSHSKLLEHSLVYTAMTRAVRQVVFVGDRAAFEGAVKNDASATKRRVGLNELDFTLLPVG